MKIFSTNFKKGVKFFHLLSDIFLTDIPWRVFLQSSYHTMVNKEVIL